MRVERASRPPEVSGMIKHLGLLPAILVVIGYAAGCSRCGKGIPDSPPAQPPELFQPYNDIQSLPTAQIERPPYRLNVADVIEIIYQVKVGAKTGDRRGYRLQSEDVIEIKFPYQNDLNQRLVVLAD